MRLEGMEGPTLANKVYPRDASFWRNPSTSSSPRSHAAHAYHWPKAEGLAASACGTVMLWDQMPSEPWSVLPFSRCQRNGCRQRWANVAAA